MTPAICCSWRTPARSAWTAPTSAISSSCPPVMRRSPGAQRKPADCRPSWCGGADRANAMSARASWPRRRRSNGPSKSACPTPKCAPAAGSVTRFDGPTRTCVSRKGLPPRSASCIRVARPAGPRRSPVTRRHAAVAASDAARAGQALDPDAVRLAVAASVRHIDTRYDELLMSGVDRETARDQVRDRVEDVLSTWRDGAAMLDT